LTPGLNFFFKMANESSTTSAKWTDQRVRTLISLYSDQVILGKTSDTGLKKEAWVVIVGKFAFSSLKEKITFICWWLVVRFLP
jgi:hypothetical protein